MAEQTLSQGIAPAGSAADTVRLEPVAPPEPSEPGSTLVPRLTAREARPAAGGHLHADSISAWFGERKVLDRVSLDMPPGAVTALIGPSGCGKSTFLRILNRMHELVPKATLAGRVMLDGADVYDPQRRLTEARSAIGMVFQKPNPFPAMSIYDNVVAGLRLTGRRAGKAVQVYFRQFGVKIEEGGFPDADADRQQENSEK